MCALVGGCFINIHGHLARPTQRRDWSAGAEATASDGEAAAIAAPGLRVLSHLLSYPLTLAHFLTHICPSPSTPRAPTGLVMLGARAEATLPSLWWRELLAYHHGSSSSSRSRSPLNLGLHMVGPELPSSSRGERVPLGDEEAAVADGRSGRGAGGELTLFRHRGLYHELLAAGDGESCLACASFRRSAFLWRHQPNQRHPSN